MRVVCCALALTAGCSFSPGRLVPGDDAPDDAAIDTTDAPDAPLADMMLDASPCSLWTPAPKHFAPCAIATPSPALVITSAASPWKLDTSTGVLSNTGGPVTVAQQTLTQTGGPDALLLSVEGLTVETGASLEITGSKPLVIASFGNVTIQGTLDATSRLGATQPGAGANPSTCATNPPTTGQGAAGVSDASGGGSGGGGGGGFRGTGGKAGPGDSGAENAGGDGGVQIASFPTVVRGGCGGGTSGMAGSSGANPTRRAAGGAGGGAIHVAARTSISITSGGRLLAGGSGGAGTENGDANGGGGGGAGGYIGLEAPSVMTTMAVLAANGGGGGGSAPFAGTGVAGQNGQPSATPAAGGDASSCSNAGGVGAAGATLNGTAASQTGVSCGGGGGGGAAGFIGVFSPQSADSGSTISPALQTNPF